MADDVVAHVAGVFGVTLEEIGIGVPARPLAIGESPALEDWQKCHCGEAPFYNHEFGCDHESTGYILCRPCDETHRPPECAIDAEGHALYWCGCRWADIEAGGPGHTCDGCENG